MFRTAKHTKETKFAEIWLASHISPSAKYNPPPQCAHWGGGLYFAEGEICEASQISANFVSFVCFAVRNTILSQPSADSSFAKGAFFAAAGRGSPPYTYWNPKKIEKTY